MNRIFALIVNKDCFNAKMLGGKSSWMSYHGNTYDGVGEAGANLSLTLVQADSIGQETGNSGKRSGNDSLKLCFCKASVFVGESVCMCVCVAVDIGTVRCVTTDAEWISATV